MPDHAPRPSTDLHKATIAAQAASAHDRLTGGVMPAIQPSTTFLRHPDQALFDGRVYARDHAPNPAEAEAVIAALEGATEARVFASGMAAITTLFRAGGPKARILAQNAGYYQTLAFLQREDARGTLSAAFFDPDQPDALAAAAAAFRPTLIFIETPANPLLQIVDIAKAAAIAHRHEGELVVDSSMATPILTRPLEFGADYVFHSATKGLNGHSDVLAGALVPARSARLWDEVTHARLTSGAQLGAFEAWLLVRGMRTLALRVERACANAAAIAQFLHSRSEVARVLYPGLPDHPGHDIAARQMQGGFGPVLSFRLRPDAHGDGEQRALRLAGRVRLIQRATSIGGVETLIEHRASVEGAYPVAPPDLLRLSVGIEHVADLIADLDQAFDP